MQIRRDVLTQVTHNKLSHGSTHVTHPWPCGVPVDPLEIHTVCHRRGSGRMSRHQQPNVPSQKYASCVDAHEFKAACYRVYVFKLLAIEHLCHNMIDYASKPFIIVYTNSVSIIATVF